MSKLFKPNGSVASEWGLVISYGDIKLNAGWFKEVNVLKYMGIIFNFKGHLCPCVYEF